MLGPLGRGDTVPVFFIKVWVHRERELTQVRGTRNTNPTQHQRHLTCRENNKNQFLQNHMLLQQRTDLYNITLFFLISSNIAIFEDSPP